MVVFRYNHYIPFGVNRASGLSVFRVAMVFGVAIDWIHCKRQKIYFRIGSICVCKWHTIPKV